MKKLMFSLLLGILIIGSIGLVIAANGNGNGIRAGQEDNFNEENVVIFQVQNRIEAGDYQINGNQLMIKEKENNRIQLKVRNISADCDCNLSEEFDSVQNRSKLKIQLSNGRNAEVKIMPDRASETALQRLRLKVCNESNNCSIELKEVGQGEGNQTRAAYEIQIQRHEKLLGLFKIKAENRVQIDAETGEVIAVKRPWWSFLAVDVEEA